MACDVLWLSNADIDALGLGMTEIMDAVERGFAAKGRGAADMPPKVGLRPRPDCFIDAMPCRIGGAVDAAGVKIVAAYPRNTQKGLPAIGGLFCLLDPETGVVLAVMNAAWITAWRTGAASGVCARRFGDPESSVAAVIGLGVQGRMNLRALREVFPKLSEVRLYGRTAANAERYVRDMEPLLPAARFVACGSPREAVSGADVVVTCTPIVEHPQRFIDAAWLKKDVLAIAVDYDAAFDAETMRGAAAFVTDDAAQYLRAREQGAHFQGYPGASALYADLGQVCAGRAAEARTGRRAAVLMGVAADDVATGQLIYRRARRAGVGSAVRL